MMVEKKKLFNLEKVEEMAQGSEGFIQQMKQVFIQSTNSALIDIRENIDEKNAKKISELAHKIKPSIDLFNIYSLKDTVRELERLGKEDKPIPELTPLVDKMEKTLKSVFEELKKAD
jgi:HPt (histidine-containing phosphotransfer) domain-containing protein